MQREPIFVELNNERGARVPSISSTHTAISITGADTPDKEHVNDSAKILPLKILKHHGLSCLAPLKAAVDIRWGWSGWPIPVERPIGMFL